MVTTIGLWLQAGPALASGASDSLLDADRALAAESHRIGFVAAYAKAMAPDARKLDSGSPTAVGRNAILALMARYPADLKLDWKPEEAVVADSGELGFTWGHFIATHHDKDGQLVTEYGKYLDVWRRKGDGAWRWIADIGSGDPGPT
jgi:ketosteroid isomerase-like protein